ncbi:iron ABC transporter permease, partial [Klebsiella pneumoniae]|nr:iron ABC transporter permease [Klebsiella pneumoniae]
AKALDAFTFGDDAAASLGIPVGYVRLILFAVTALMTAAIVSMAGSIGFAGLVVPHVVRRLVTEDIRLALPLAAPVGALALVLADIAARTLVAPQELATG